MAHYEEDREYIRELNEQTGNSQTKAQELYWQEKGQIISLAYIRRVWDEAGFERNPHGGRRNGMPEEEFRILYENCGGDVQEMATKSGHKASSLTTKCRKLGLPSLNKPESSRIDGSFSVDPDTIRPRF